MSKIVQVLDYFVAFWTFLVAHVNKFIMSHFFLYHFEGNITFALFVTLGGNYLRCHPVDFWLYSLVSIFYMLLKIKSIFEHLTTQITWNILIDMTLQMCFIIVSPLLDKLSATIRTS